LPSNDFLYAWRISEEAGAVAADFDCAFGCAVARGSFDGLELAVFFVAAEALAAAWPRLVSILVLFLAIFLVPLIHPFLSTVLSKKTSVPYSCRK
jgi:hypothetical protein